MSKASTKQVLTAIGQVMANIPEVVESFTTEDLQRIIDSLQTSGRELGRFMKNGARVQIIGNHVIDCDAYPVVPDGWSVKKHKRNGQFQFDPSKIKLVVKLNAGESYVDGEELRKRLKKERVLNANVLDYLLAHPELILEEWKGKYIFFWGTIYRDSFGYLCVRYLRWDGRRWGWHVSWLDGGWDAGRPAVVES